MTKVVMLEVVMTEVTMARVALIEVKNCRVYINSVAGSDVNNVTESDVNGTSGSGDECRVCDSGNSTERFGYIVQLSTSEQ